MATRFYLPSTGAAAISPAYNASWEDTSIATRLAAVTAKIASAMTTVDFVDADETDKDILFRQYVSDILPAGQTITGSQALKFQIRGIHANLLNNMYTALGIRVIADSGTFVKTIVSVTRDDSELPTSLGNRQFTATSLPSNYTTKAGDRLVIEIGASGNPDPTGTHSSSLRIGDADANDLPEDNAATDDYNPWVELTDTLAFGVGWVAPPQRPPAVLGMDQRRPFGPGRFRTPVGTTTLPVAHVIALIPAESGRLDLTIYNTAGATVQGTGPVTVLSAEISEKLNEVRTFSCRVPAGEVNSVELVVARMVRLSREGDGVIFTGYIETLEYSDQGDAPVINVTGVGLEIELVEVNVYYGLNLTGTTSAKVTQLLALVTGTTWTASVEGGIYAVADYRIDGMSVWAALVELAQKAGGYIRLTTTTRQVELAAANASSGLLLTNVEGQVPASLGANIGLITALRGYREDASAIVNRVVPFGASSLVSVADLRLSTRSSPYTIQSLIPQKPQLLVSEGAGPLTAASKTFSFGSVSGRNLFFIAIITFHNGWGSSYVSNITLNGVWLTGWVSTDTGVYMGQHILTIWAPDAGATMGIPEGKNLTLVLNMDSGSPVFDIWGGIFSDVDPAEPVEASAVYGTGTGTAVASGAQSAAVTDYILGVSQRNGANISSRGSGETALYSNGTIDVITMPGAASVEATWTLSASADWIARAFVIHPAPNYYIEDATSVAAHRRRTAIWQAKDLHLSDPIASANALYDAAATCLQRAKDPLIHYGETEPLGLGAATWALGNTIRLMYRRVTTSIFGTVVKWPDVDANAILLEQTQAFGEDGVRRWKMRLASAIKQPPTLLGLMSKVDELARLPAL